jgi:hypothetical protein
MKLLLFKVHVPDNNTVSGVGVLVLSYRMDSTGDTAQEIQHRRYSEANTMPRYAQDEQRHYVSSTGHNQVHNRHETITSGAGYPRGGIQGDKGIQ